MAEIDSNIDTGGRPVWAPWRIEYIRMPKDGECFLCAAAERGAPDEDSLLVAKGRHCLVILNRFPYNPGHLMVAPIRHVGDISDTTAEERAETMELIVRSKEVLSKTLSPDGFNIGFNLGAVAGAGLETHLHAHIVPRWSGDTNFMPVIGGARVVPEALVETWKLLSENWGD